MDNFKKDLNSRINALGWALFFIATGIVWLIPDNLMPGGSWLIIIGGILLTVNLLKTIFVSKSSGFGYFIGILFLIWGIMQIVKNDLPFWPIFLITLGIITVVSGAFETRFKIQKKEEEK